MAELPSAPHMAALLTTLLLLLAVPGAGAGVADQSELTEIPYNIYHSSDSIFNEVKALVDDHPNRLSMEILSASNRGYFAEIPVVTFNNVQSQISDDSKLRVLLSFGQHAREIITSEVAIQLLYVMMGEQKISYKNFTYLEDILDQLVIKVVPMENVNGRKVVQAGNTCERRNGRGVDLNRNWGVDWGKKEKDYDPSEEYPGTGAFSEPEAQLMRKLSLSFSPHIWVNVHSGMEALFMPYDHKNTTPDGSLSLLMRSVLNDINLQVFQGNCVVGSGGGSVGYLAHGTTIDYMYDVVRVPMPFTFEIYGDDSASSKDCIKMFNPVDEATFHEVVNKWCAALLMLFEEGLMKKTSILMADGAAPANSLRSRNGTEDSLIENRRRRKLEGLDLGLQELRMYFRLFMVSSVLLLFMFCSRIPKIKRSEHATPS